MSALEGKAALITGGGSGIGLACAAHLLRDGATVTLAGRSKEKLQAAASSLDGGGEVRTVSCDVADEDQVRRAVEVASSESDGLHIAVAAAGTGAGGPLLQTDLATWRSVLSVNLDGAFLTFKHAGAAIVDSGGGAMVGISSIAAPLTHRLMAAYSVSKAALEALVRNAADELGDVGVRVNAVRPGLVPTDLASGLTASEGIVADYLDQMPIRRLGTVDDVAALVRFLAGPESSWITGQCIGVDGGHTLRRGPDLLAAARQPRP